MAQTVKYVDLTRSYIPLDPNSFPDGLHIADMQEENRVPVMPIDGGNFLPTAYGYKSYFGTEVTLAVDDFLERVDWLLLFQNDSMNNFLIALCDSGIWYKAGSTSGAWTQAVVLPHNRDNPLVHYKWTFCVLANVLYCYRENGANFYTIESEVAAPGISINTKTPSFLNMAAQKGIFSAGNRLGMWDSDDSISWSTLDDKENFTPDLETLAGFMKLDQLVGRIVTIRAHGDDFIVYATKSIVHVQKQSESLFLWEPRAVLKDTGIAYPENMVASVPDTVHFAYTPVGLYKIENGSAEIIVPEITDFFRNRSEPKYLALSETRYLFVQIMDPDYVTGFPLIVEGEIPALEIPLGATSLQDLSDATQSDPPTLSTAELVNLLQLGVFVPRPVEGEEPPPPIS